MPAEWRHPTWGTFTFDVTKWAGTVAAPSFDAFTWDRGFQRPPPGVCELSFDADADDDFPSEDALAVAARVLANAPELVTKVVEALWDEFNGRGPYTGMWWHGDLGQVAEALDDHGAELAPPGRPADLFTLLGFSRIRVRKRVARYEKPVVELVFGAPFEEEHGLGVLTDGDRILGIGYSHDVGRFYSE